MVRRLLLLTSITVALAGCNIHGSGTKGPFSAGSNVSFSQLDSAANPIASTTLTGQVLDTQGAYSISEIEWSGWSELTISGQYFDELTGQQSATAITLNAITNKNQRFDVANIHLFSHLAAARMKQRIANGDRFNRAWRRTQQEIKQLFNLRRTGAGINKGVEQLNLLQGYGYYRRDNATLLLFTGAFLAANGDESSLQQLTEDFADDAQFNGVAEAFFGEVAAQAAQEGLLESLGTHLKSIGITNPPDSRDLRQLPAWVDETGTTTDTIAPVITLNGSATIELTKGETYEEAGASAVDETDGDVSVERTGSVDTDTIGEYTLTYTATDAAGNTATKTRTVNVSEEEDTIAPEITVLGANPASVVQGDEYSDAGATATDNRDESVEVVTTGSVDTDTVGEYTLTYTATDAAGNEQTATRTVNVTQAADTTDPVITLLGDNPVNMVEGTNYVEAGANATDDRDGAVDVVITGSVDNSTVGTYTLTYTATDNAGNTASVTRTVNVTAAPVVSYRCPASIGSEAAFLDDFIINQTNDQPWPEDFAYNALTVSEIEVIFNNARAGDRTLNDRVAHLNQRLDRGSKLKMPTQAVWDGMTDSQKALYLINSERCARGIRPFEAVDPTIVATPAQYYANYLADNDVFSHTADGRDPWQRLNQDAGVDTTSNADFFSYSENLAFSAVLSTRDYPVVHEPVAKAVYGWIYDDKADTTDAQGVPSYGHRKFIFAVELVDNSGTDREEGLIGVGVASAQSEVTSNNGTVFKQTKTYTVLNGFDPNSSWDNNLENKQTVDLLAPESCLTGYRLVNYTDGNNDTWTVCRPFELIIAQ